MYDSRSLGTGVGTNAGAVDGRSRSTAAKRLAESLAAAARLSTVRDGPRESFADVGPSSVSPCLKQRRTRGSKVSKETASKEKDKTGGGGTLMVKRGSPH